MCHPYAVAIKHYFHLHRKEPASSREKITGMTETSVTPTIDVIEDALAHRNSVADQKDSFNLKRLVRHQSADPHRRPAMAADIRPEDFVEQV